MKYIEKTVNGVGYYSKERMTTEDKAMIGFFVIWIIGIALRLAGII